MANDTRSYSQKKRDKMDYRREYFKHNPGLFGCIWTCAYCHRPIIGKENVQVDHIIPLNNVLGRNARFNLVAACGKCNRAKSDKFDGRVVEGYVSKLLEIIIFGLQKAVIVLVVACWVAIMKIFQILKKIISAPFKSDNIVVKGIAYAVVAYCIYVIYRRFS